MKLSINDDCGTKAEIVFNCDGSPATEDKDFIFWEGKYHKNGKWSYTEGGVALKDGIVLVTNRSTHRSSNFIKSLIIIKDNKQMTKIILGKIKEMNERPENCHLDYISNVAFDAIIEKMLDIYDAKRPGAKAETLARWGKMSQFV